MKSALIYRTRRRGSWWREDSADQIRYFYHRSYAEQYATRWKAKGYTVAIDVALRTEWKKVTT